jgi:mxaK protein
MRVNEAIAAVDAEVASRDLGAAGPSTPGSGPPASGASAGGSPGSGAPVSGALAGGAPGNGAPASGASGNGAPGSGASSRAPADNAAASSLPEAQFAYAIALAKRGDYEGALKQYKVLSRGSRADVATDALYNAGNLQLREALKEGREATVRALPLIELAKQSYRGVLRRDPQSWDARYNLERALWLAPELDEVLSESVTRDAENRVMSTLQRTRADLP